MPTAKCQFCRKTVSPNKDYCKSCAESAPQRIKILEQIYARVPNVKCKGLCVQECVNVPIMPIEAFRILQSTGVETPRTRHPSPQHPGVTFLYHTLGENTYPRSDLLVTDKAELSRLLSRNEVNWCPFLKAGRCSIYPIRPLICREYGHPIMTLKCAHGCEIEGEWTEADASQVLQEIMKL